MRILFVVAHPDDECDGAGATICKLASEDNAVAVVFLVGNVEARRNLSSTISEEMEASKKILGIEKLYRANFPNVQMNVIANGKVVSFIKQCIEDWQPEAVFTHHPTDTNDDHIVTSLATVEAIKGQGVKEFFYLEAASATEWSLQSKRRFLPNTYVSVGKDCIEKKLQALDVYRGVSRPYPHPQCRESYMGLAAFRGAQSGFDFAEAFECVYRIV